MADENAEARKRSRANSANLAWKNWSEADAHMRGLRTQLEGTTFGRQILIAVDKFAGMAGQYFDPNCIEFFHRMDNDEGEKEQFLQDMGDAEKLACAYFVKLVFDDPREESGKVTDAGQTFTMKKMTQGLTYEVQDLSGKMIASGNVKKSKTLRGSAVVSREGRDENTLIDLLEECMEDAAKQINDRFVARVIFKAISSVKNDEDFNEDAGSLEIDGATSQLGMEVSLLKGKHTVVVDMDGYKQKGASLFNITKSGEQKIVMVSTNCNLTVNVKGPAGDADFDASNATIELTAGEDVSESLTAGEESIVPQGKYTLTVTMDGYSAKPQTVSLAKTKQAITVQMKKDAAPVGNDEN